MDPNYQIEGETRHGESLEEMVVYQAKIVSNMEKLPLFYAEKLREGLLLPDWKNGENMLLPFEYSNVLYSLSISAYTRL